MKTYLRHGSPVRPFLPEEDALITELREEIKDADDALLLAHDLQGFATGHGDTLADLVMSLSIQSRDRAAMLLTTIDAIQRYARSDGRYTFDDASRALGLIDDLCRSALRQKGPLQ